MPQKKGLEDMTPVQVAALTPEQQRKAQQAADRRRQRANLKRLKEGRHDEIELTPLQRKKLQNEAAAAAAGSSSGLSGWSSANGFPSFTTNSAWPTPATPWTPSSSSTYTPPQSIYKGKGEALGREDAMDIDEDPEDREYRPSDSESPASRRASSRLTSINRKPHRSAFINNHQMTPTEEYLESAQWVERDGQLVPRLVTAQNLDLNTIAGMNGIVVAHMFKNQGPGFFFELFRNLQKENGVTWRRCLQIMCKLMDEEKEKEKFAEARKQATNIELGNHSYMVPEDYAGNDIDDNFGDDGSSSEDDFEENALEEDSEDDIPVTAAHVPRISGHNGQPTPFEFLVEVTRESTCQNIMDDIKKYVHLTRGARLDSTNRKIMASEAIRQDRVERFEKLSYEQHRRQVEVDRLRQTYPRGVRTLDTLRTAFDHVASQLEGPKGHWKNSNHWFVTTLDTIDSEPELCNLLFEYNTHHFLAELKEAMVKADEGRSLELLKIRSEEQYADLMGQEKGGTFVDQFYWL